MKRILEWFKLRCWRLYWLTKPHCSRCKYLSINPNDFPCDKCRGMRAVLRVYYKPINKNKEGVKK